MPNGIYPEFPSSGSGGGDNQFVYRGTYNAATNTPTLENGTGTQGDWYLVSVAGDNNPTGEMLNVNQVIAYNGYTWEAGGQIDNTDEMVVAPGYIVIRGQTIQVGQSVTVALGVLEGEIADVNQALITAINNLGLQVDSDTQAIGILQNAVASQGQSISTLQTNFSDLNTNKQNKIATPTADNLAAMDSTGQTTNSGIAKSSVTTQGNNFNGDGQLIKTTSDGKIPALYSGDTTVANPTSLTVTPLNTALENVFMSIPAAQVQSNWNETNNTLPSFIKNKPTLFVNPMTAAGDLIYGGTPSGGVAPPTRLAKGSSLQALQIDPASGLPAWISNPGLYQYSKLRYVDPVNGVDNPAQSGAYGAPFKTVAYALTRITTGMIVALMGQTSEPSFSITLTNIDIVAFGTRSALNGFLNGVTVSATAAGSIRFQSLNFASGLARSSTSTSGLYLYGCSIGTSGFTQAGNGYTEFNDCDASNANNIITAGTFVVNAGKLIAPTVSGTGTFVSLNNAGQILGNSTVAVGSTFSAVLSIWVSASTGYALSNVAGSVVLLDGVQYVRPDLATLATVSLLGNYSIQYTELDRANSVLTGTNLSSLDWFDGLGLLAADTITGATKMLVRKPTGEIAEQTIQTVAAPLSFNVPISTVYADAAVPASIVLRNSGGTTQLTQNGLLCNANGLFNVQQLFSITVANGQTININGRITFYNINPITTVNYYTLIQVVGVTAGGQLVNLGTGTSVNLSKAQYAYTNADFSATQAVVTNLVAIGVQAQVIYGEANNTALVNTMYATLTIS